MQPSAEIVSLPGVLDTLLIGPRAAFGRGHRHAVQSEDAIRTRLNAARADPGALGRLRRGFDRWRLGEAFLYLDDRAMIDRVAADTRRGRLACYVVPNGEIRYWRHPDPGLVGLRLAGLAPRGSARSLATAGRVISWRAGAPVSVALTRPAPAGAPVPVGGPLPGIGPNAAVVHRPADLPLNVGAMPLEERLVEILHRTTDSARLEPETVSRLKAMLEPEQLAQTIAVLLVWAASHAVGIGFALDAVLLGAGPMLTGRAVTDAARGMKRAFEIATGAKSEAELDLAADLLAIVVATVGIGVLQSAIRRGATRVRGGEAKPASPFGRIEEHAALRPAP